MSPPPDALLEPEQRLPVRDEADVLVVGGGSAGVAAAVAAARAGADALLVEATGALGGLATDGLIILLLTLDDGRGRQAVAGLCQELTERLVARGAAFHPPPEEWGSADPARVERARRWGLVWGRAPHRVRYSVAYDPAFMKGELDALVAGSGARLLLHAWAARPLVAEGRVQGVAFESRAGRFAVRARTVVDATGDAHLAALAGCAFESERVLPWMWFTAGGVDVARAREAGAACFQTLGEGKVLLPWGATEKVGRIDPTVPEERTRAEVDCRRRVLEAFERLRAETPGFERAHLCELPAQLGITESRRLVGRRVLAREEMDVVLEDAVAVTGHWTKYGAIYHVPYDCLLSRELPNLLVAGRCISVDHRVHHATKEIPACMATGEAAGTAAALAAAKGVEPCALPVSEIRGRLAEVGAILRLPPLAEGDAARPG